MMILGVNARMIGAHLASWRHPDSWRPVIMNLQNTIDCAQIAESGKLARLAKEAMKSSLEVLGLLHTPSSDYRTRTRARRLSTRGLTAVDIEQKLTARAEARATKDFARSDQIRAELEALGVEVSDSPAGTTWSMRI